MTGVMVAQPYQPTKDDVPSRLEIGNDTGRDSATQCRFCGLQLHEHDRVKRFPDDGPAGSFCYEYQCPGEQETLDWSATHRPYLHEE